MLRTIKTQVFYPYPPQRIWQVLTERRALSAWLMDNDFEPRVGHKFRFQHSTSPGLDGTIHCEVIELAQPKCLSYTWQDSLMHQPSIVTWTLEPVDGGTRLQLEHRNLQCQDINLNKSEHRWQSYPIYQPPQALVTQTQSLNATCTHLEPEQIGFVSHIESGILNFYLNGGWDYLLNKKFLQTLADAASNEVIFNSF